jgi:hypothetical protein
MDQIRVAFKRTFPKADVSILDTVPNLMDGTIFSLETGRALYFGGTNQGRGIEQGTLVRLDSEAFEQWLEEMKVMEEDKAEDEDGSQDDREDSEDMAESYTGNLFSVAKSNQISLAAPACDKEITGWQTIELYEVSQTSNNSNGDVTLLPGSKDNITYELYPMEQGGEFSIENLGFEGGTTIPPSETFYDCQTEIILQNNKFLSKDMSLSMSESDTKFIAGRKFSIGDMDLYIGSYGQFTSRDGGIIYVLVKGNEVLSGFKDKHYLFQEGDGETNVYSYEDKIVIHNMGDVSSIVIIKLN